MDANAQQGEAPKVDFHNEPTTRKQPDLLYGSVEMTSGLTLTKDEREKKSGEGYKKG